MLNADIMLLPLNGDPPNWKQAKQVQDITIQENCIDPEVLPKLVNSFFPEVHVINEPIPWKTNNQTTWGLASNEKDVYLIRIITRPA